MLSDFFVWLRLIEPGHPPTLGGPRRWSTKMKNLLLAAAAVVAIGSGTAFADSDLRAQSAQVSQSGQQGQSALANDSHASVWIYPAFRGDAFAEGGER